MKKLKLLPTILMLVLCVGVLAIGIYAVTPTKNTISGSITINASNPEVFISAYTYNEDGTMATSPYYTERSSRSGIDITLPSNITLNSDQVNTKTELDALSVKIGIKVRSEHSQSLGVYFSSKEMSDSVKSSSDIETNYVLVNDASQNSVFSASLTGYTELPQNGEVIMQIVFKFDQFPTQNSTINLGIGDGQMPLYLNVEQVQGQYLAGSKLTIVSNTTQPVDIEVLKDGSLAATRFTSDSLTGIANKEVCIGINNFSFFSAGTSLTHIPDMSVTLKVTNKGTSGIGAFFLKDALVDNALADVQNIRLLDESVANQNGTNVASASFTPYMYIAKNGYTTNSKTGFDTVEMTIVLRATNLSNLTVNNLNYTLVLEDYVASENIITNPGYTVYDSETSAWTTTLTETSVGNPQFTDDFLKLPDTLTEIESLLFYNNDNIKHLVIPSSVTSCRHSDVVFSSVNNAFKNCDGILSVGFNSSAITGSDYSCEYLSLFHGMTNLKHLAINQAVLLFCEDIASDALEYLQFNSTLQSSRCSGFFGFGIPKIKSFHIGSFVTEMFNDNNYSSSDGNTNIFESNNMEKLVISENVVQLDYEVVNQTTLKTIYVKAGSTATANLPDSGWFVKTETVDNQSVTSITDRDEDAVYWRA